MSICICGQCEAIDKSVADGMKYTDTHTVISHRADGYLISGLLSQVPGLLGCLLVGRACLLVLLLCCVPLSLCRLPVLLQLLGCLVPGL